MDFYQNFKDACSRKGTTVTQVLKAIHRSTSCTGGWSSGHYPQLNIVMEMADYLGISLDELVYGSEVGKSHFDTDQLSEDEKDWLSIISCIPVDKQKICRDFLKTHMAAPLKYREKRNA